MDFSILYTSFLAIIESVIVSILLYLLLFFVLKKQNKYNVKNAWFVILSIIIVPILMVEMAGLFASNSLKSSVVKPANVYATELAIHLDSLATDASAYVNGIISNQIVDAAIVASDFVNDKIYSTKEELTENAAVNLLGGAVIDTTASALQNVSDNIIVETAVLIQDGISEQVNSLVEGLPTDILAELKVRFPALTRFLGKYDLQGANNREIVDYLFYNINSSINRFEINRLKDIIIWILILCGISILAGYRKKRKLIMIEESQM